MDAEPARRCAYLTMDDSSGFVTDADLSVPAMAALGWTVEFVSWRTEDVDWDGYELVYICTPWDYQDDPDAYLAVLADIDQSAALLVNSVATVRYVFVIAGMRSVFRSSSNSQTHVNLSSMRKYVMSRQLAVD